MIVSSLVLGSQRFAADFLCLVAALFWRFWVRLHVSAIKTEERKQKGHKSVHMLTYTQAVRAHTGQHIIHIIIIIMH